MVVEQKPNVVGPFSLNIAASIGIIFLNKIVFKTLGFPGGTTLTFIHFVCTIIGLYISRNVGLFKAKKLKFVDVLPLGVGLSLYIGMNNLSLSANSVSIYQVMKIMGTPACVVINAVMYKQKFSMKVWVAVLLVCLGVGVSTISDGEVKITFAGAIFGIAGFICNALYVTWGGRWQKKLDANSFQLLSVQMPISAFFMFIFIFFFDDVEAVVNYEYTFGAYVAIFTTGIVSFFVNLSVFLVIGRAGPVTYAVISNIKTVIILAGGIIFFGDPLTPKIFLGIVITLSGVVLYSYETTMQKIRQKPSQDILKLKDTVVNPIDELSETELEDVVIVKTDKTD
ncbi:hypothetical protein PCE1_001850 [Barthelona sp. PCE]